MAEEQDKKDDEKLEWVILLFVGAASFGFLPPW
jgi:hypothetical protein